LPYRLGSLMRALALCLCVMDVGFLVSCSHATRSVEIPAQGLGRAGTDVVVRLEVPADWRPLAASPARAEFLAPDNRSRAYVRAMLAAADVKRCPAVARQYASEFIEAWGPPPATRVASKTSAGESVNIELRRADPKPDGEVIWARVVCREGMLAVTSCTVPAPREQEMKGRCRDMMQSLQILRGSKPPSTPAGNATKSS
jgi:hypothetical protein